MHKFVSASSLFLGVMLSISLAHATTIQQLWSVDTHMVMEGAAIAVDLDNDGDDEIVTAAYQSVIAIDGDGKELWRFETTGRYQTCPAVLKRDGQTPLLYAADSRGVLTCLDALGKVVWQAETGSVFCSSPTVANIYDATRPEVLQSDKTGKVHVFDAQNGNSSFLKKFEGELSSVAVADVDKNGIHDLVVTSSTGKLHVFIAESEQRFTYELGGTTPDWATCSPIIFANAQDERLIVCASGTGRVVCLDGLANLRWERLTRGAVASTLSAGDFDGDGLTDIFAVTQLGVLYRFDETGKTIWDIDTQGRSLAPGAIIDIDGDARLDYVLCTQNGGLFVFNQEGAVIFSHQFPNRTINVTPAFGDIVKDRPGLEFAVTGGESGKVFCFSTAAPADAASPWRAYRGDEQNTAFVSGPSTVVARMHPVNLAWDELLTGEDVRFDIANPSGNILTAEATCLRPDGSRQSAVSKVVGATGILQLPLSLTGPGLYQFHWALRDGGANPVARGSRTVTLQPFAIDNAHVQRALLALQNATGESPIYHALAAEARALQEEHAALLKLQSATPGADPPLLAEIRNRTAALNHRARRALSLTRIAPEMDPGADLVAFTTDMWESRDIDKQVPARGSSYIRIRRRCVTGEHEPISVKLTNVSTDSVSVTAEPGRTGISIRTYHVKSVPANVDTVAWDPIIPFSDGPLEIPPLETREAWIDIDLAGVKPGEHEVSIKFNTGATTTSVHAILDVLPFDMAGYDKLRLCCWANYNDHVVNDLLAHSNTVFIPTLPSATVSEDGSSVALNSIALDEFLKPMKGHDVYLLFNGVPSLGVPETSNEYVPRLASYFDQLFARLNAAGINEENVAMYPYDEPGTHGWETVKKYMAFAQQALKARPSLKFYVNGGGDLPMLQELAKVAGVWSPAFFALPDQSPEMALMRNSGKTLWSYDCAYTFSRPIGANTKATNIVAQYRLAPIIAMNYGATGLGYWSYNIGDPMWDRVPFEYPIVYANPDGTTTSCRRWEAVREGMEDARILLALRSKLDDPAVADDAKTRIRALLDNTVRAISEQAMEQSRVGVARYVIDAANNDETVNALRKEMLDCVVALQK